ncbi:hypothetical protein KKA47_06460, partial [bacterium]|nr:hypothetical protein [bacterium]
YTLGSVPCWWLTITRAGLSSLFILASLGALMTTFDNIVYKDFLANYMTNVKRYLSDKQNNAVGGLAPPVFNDMSINISKYR